MAGVVIATVDHFTHEHPLTKYIDGEERVCDGCKVPIRNVRYGCKSCDFYLHEFCATSPASLFTPKHPEHELALARMDNHSCNLCRDRVEGLFYRCKDCDFDLHPLCSHMPLLLQHVLHRDHPLELYIFTSPPTSPPPCLICNGKCTSIHYRCETSSCGVYVHPECVRPNTWTVPAQATTVQALATTVPISIPAQRRVRKRDKFLGVAETLVLSVVGSELYEHVKELKEFVSELEF